MRRALLAPGQPGEQLRFLIGSWLFLGLALVALFGFRQPAAALAVCGPAAVLFGLGIA